MSEACRDCVPRSACKTGFRKLSFMLSGLLVAQLGLAGLLLLGHADYRAVNPSASLLQLDPESARTITIENGKSVDGSKSAKITLRKANAAWVLSEQNDLPVDPRYISKLLNAMGSWKKGIPVTVSADALERFKVAAGNFEAAMTLEDDKAKACKFYIGTSPVFKTRYVRLENNNDIYSVEMPESFNLPVNADEIFDKNFARPNSYAIKSLNMEGLTLKAADGGRNWLVSEGGKEKTVQSAYVRKLLKHYLDISVRTLLGVNPDPSYNSEHPDLVLTLDLGAGPITYSFSKPADKSQFYHVLKMSNRNCYLKVDDAQVDTIKKLPSEILAVDSDKSAK